MDIACYAEELVKSICVNKDLVKVKLLENNELLILVPEDEMGRVLGFKGKNIKAIRCLVEAYSYLHDKSKVKIDIESF